MTERRPWPRVPFESPRAECYRCFKPQVTCVCASIEPVANQTGLLILQHPRERFHPLGTARFARLGFAHVRVESCSPWLIEAAQRTVPSQTALLYPAPGARELASVPPEERPRYLIVLDGTWSHAKKIYEARQWLHALPHLRLTPPAPSRYRLRAQPNPMCVATLEAIVYALQIIEPETRGLDGLLRSFAVMIDRQMACVAAGGAPASSVSGVSCDRAPAP